MRPSVRLIALALVLAALSVLITVKLPDRGFALVVLWGGLAVLAALASVRLAVLTVLLVVLFGMRVRVAKA